MIDWSDTMVQVLVALGVAVVVVVAARLVCRLAARRWPQVGELERRSRVPFRVLVLMVTLNPVVATLRPAEADTTWWVAGAQAAEVLAIVAAGWFLTSVVLFLEDVGLSRYRVDVADNRLARRMRTQVLVIRRLTIAAGAVVTLGAVLLSFPGVKAIGASVLASAGLISVVAALAAQSVLANVFAGIQIAFGDAVRLDDVVIVEDEWGWIEEITLTYVVVRLWDDRRLVLPSTYFTTTPFQNWTRHKSELLGSVELDVDWRVDTAALREQLDVALSTTDLWDGRGKVLQVTDAVGGWVRVRVLVTASDAPRLFDLRCHVREHLVTWIRDHDAGVPRQRVELVERPRSA
ncbi:mechanosensitive ion channel family protein [Nocardioides mangrovi]|uniref:Mechanosensitive ion channel family protein n=1 Tax=Nocardioides mangrovi TaxID=2874580 RepID=A0ABS7UCI3_9ACTN|nr:mechanosensitive ion channel domain-containing protein [Nocardioides mangrovi]MBZ5738373.1 mechanosensitive ion channel family protein [Nocardioides mangrovi]